MDLELQGAKDGVVGITEACATHKLSVSELIESHKVIAHIAHEGHVVVFPNAHAGVQAGNGQAVAPERGIAKAHEGDLLVYVSAPHIPAYDVSVLDGDIVSKEEAHASLGNKGKPADRDRHSKICSHDAKQGRLSLIYGACEEVSPESGRNTFCREICVVKGFYTAV